MQLRKNKKQDLVPGYCILDDLVFPVLNGDFSEYPESFEFGGFTFSNKKDKAISSNFLFCRRIESHEEIYEEVADWVQSHNESCVVESISSEDIVDGAICIPLGVTYVPLIIRKLAKQRGLKINLGV